MGVDLRLLVSVEFGAIWDSESGKRLASIPMTAMEFIRQFDQGLATAPFSFDVKC